MPLFSRRNNNAVAHPTESSSSDFERQATQLIPVEVRMISGCHTEQTSADVSHVTNKLPNPAGRAGGACTSALLEILYQKQQITFQDLLLELRKSLSSKGFDQIPQLTSSRPLETQQTPFTLVKNANGNKRALLVGINYNGQSGELSGCHNDVFNVKRYLVEKQGYPEHNILVMVDDHIHHYPTRQKMIAALRQLVLQSVSGDSVYFHYSGHGGLLVPDGNAYKNNNKEYDETLYPLDHERSGQIRDFSLYHHFVKPMPAGVLVTCVMDCCHSGSVLDLPYSFQPTSAGTIRMRQNMSHLTNLAFLYILAGGMLPVHGFENITQNIEDVTGGDMADYQGTGMDDATAQDGFNLEGNQDVAASAPEDGDGADYGGDAGDYGGTDGFAGDHAYGGGGFGDGVGYSGGDGGGFDAGDGGDMDCGCVQDVLESLLDGAGDF